MHATASHDRRIVLCFAFVVTAVTLLVGSTAQAATVTVGSQLTAPFGETAFTAPKTIANVTLPAPANVASPVDGTVISWRANGSGTLIPRIVRPISANTFTGAGTGNPQTLGGFGAISGPFATSLPIRRGDLFGVDGGPPASIGVINSTGGFVVRFTPPLADGGAAVGPDGGAPIGLEAAISATVRYCVAPAVVGRKLASARRALTAADCTLGKVTKKRSRKAKKTRVSRQSVAPGTSISDTVPIDLTVKKPKKK